MAFEAGQKVVCLDVGPNFHLTKGKEYVVNTTGVYVDIIFVTVTNDAGVSTQYYGSRFGAAALPIIDASMLPARSNDPDTSKAAAKIKRPKIRDTILDLLDKYKTGLTGQEIAEYSGYRLNSVTPRFAELARKGGSPYQIILPKIRDSGHRRSGQIVWVLL